VWGERLLPRLDGPFALAVHDAEAGTLLLARDRFGQRPLCYAAAGDAFAFASEIQALLAWPGVEREPDLDVVAHILSFGHGPADRAPFAGMRRLRPGHLLRRRADGCLEEACWWGLPERAAGDEGPGFEEVQARFDAAVAAAAQGADAVLLDDGEAAAALAARLGRTGHGGRVRQLRLEADAAPWSPALLSELLWHAGEPVLHPEAPALRAALAETGGRALSAAGGCELLLAHRRYRRFAAALARWREEGRPPADWRAGFHDTPPFARDIYHAAAGGLPEAERLDLCGPALMHTLLFSMPDALGASLEQAGEADAAERAARLDIAFRVPAFDLAAMDAAAAAAGTPVPDCPFLDRRLVESALAAPPAARHRLVEGGAAHRPPAAPGGDGGPGQKESAELRDLIADTLLGARSRERGLFNPAVVGDLLRPCAASPRHLPHALRAVLGIELWFQDFVDASPERREPPRPRESASAEMAA